jgi:hypothetical protein
MKDLIRYLAQRPDAFLLAGDLDRTLTEIFPRPEWVLPHPYKIFLEDESQPPVYGFPVSESPVMKELDVKLERWITEEVACQTRRDAPKEKAQQAFGIYLGHLMRLAENAMMSNLLADYHAIFWLAHSFDLARQFSSIPRKVSAIDAQLGRTQGDSLKYKIFTRWATETREQMTQLAARLSTTLDGEEQRGLQFFRILQDNVLILTEDFIGPDLRELRSFVTGHLRREFQPFRDAFERMRNVANDLLVKDRAFKATIPLFGGSPDPPLTFGLLLDNRFQEFFFDQPAAQNAISREDREQMQLQARRLREFAVLNQLRRAIVSMAATVDGEIVASDRRGTTFSRSTRPMDFGRSGVVDPMVYRFGLMYDISAFSETLGSIAKGGRREEVSSYRQMLLFQRKMQTITERASLQFEKFLGDGAFYTTRRPMALIRAAIEIQRSYSDMRKKGFAFNKGLRIALNYGYYRLLPMQGAEGERMMEFYGPGIVELSRLTTGKANKEIEEIQGFLTSHGYDQAKVQAFFAPLARGVDVIDHKMHSREFYAYVNANGHLVNEGIVGSFQLMHELSTELLHEAQQLYRIVAPFGTYHGFTAALQGIEFVGARLIGAVSLKGLDTIEVCELVSFAPGESEATAIDSTEPLTILLRQEFHNQQLKPTDSSLPFLHDTTETGEITGEIILCMRIDEAYDQEVLIGQWDPLSDDVREPLRLPTGDFRRLIALRGPVTTEEIENRKDSVVELYHRLCDRTGESLRLSPYRQDQKYAAFLLGSVVERL